jgi:polar amino acid transport system substrate-binding protein
MIATRNACAWQVLLLLASTFGMSSGCMPQDPNGTYNRVRGDVLRVGISSTPPWVIAGEEPSGIEIDLVQDLAVRLGAEVSWETDTESRLLEKLEKWELDLVVCGLRDKNPWSKRVGLTRPFLIITQDGKKHEHVWAVPPGENEWLLHVQRFLNDSRDTARRLWEEYA